MGETVIDRQEISLDGKRYRIAPRQGGSVQSFIASGYPRKIVCGRRWIRLRPEAQCRQME